MFEILPVEKSEIKRYTQTLQTALGSLKTIGIGSGPTPPYEGPTPPYEGPGASG